MIRRSRSFLLLAGLGVIRFAAAGVGPVYPTAGAAARSDRPSASAVMPGNGTPTLVLFAHPRGGAIGDPAALIARGKAALPVATSHGNPEARRFGAGRGAPAGPPALDEPITRDETGRKTTVVFGCARYARHTISESS
jgi:hypothetical protein